MSKEYKELIVGLDIGTAKVTCMVAEVRPDGRLFAWTQLADRMTYGYDIWLGVSSAADGPVKWRADGGGLQDLDVHVVWRCHVGREVPNECTELAWGFLRRHQAAVRQTVFMNLLLGLLPSTRELVVKL